MKGALTRLLRSVAALVLALGAGTLVTAAPAQAAPLDCGRAFTDTVGDNTYVVHSCSGTGTIEYTVDCLVGSNAVFSRQWKPPGGSYRWPYTCALDSGFAVTYRVIR